jgi:hypothetical protein
VARGTVQLRTPVGETAAQATQMASAAGYQTQPVQAVPAARAAELAGQVQALGRYAKKPGGLERFERALAGALDPALQLLGLTPGAWSYANTEFVRQTDCVEALRKLDGHLRGGADDVPETLNLATLEEAQLPADARARTLKALAGGVLESYRKTGRGSYVLRAHSRDRSRTLYEMAGGKIHAIRE